MGVCSMRGSSIDRCSSNIWSSPLGQYTCCGSSVRGSEFSRGYSASFRVLPIPGCMFNTRKFLSKSAQAHVAWMRPTILTDTSRSPNPATDRHRLVFRKLRGYYANAGQRVRRTKFFHKNYPDHKRAVHQELIFACCAIVERQGSLK